MAALVASGLIIHGTEYQADFEGECVECHAQTFSDCLTCLVAMPGQAQETGQRQTMRQRRWSAAENSAAEHVKPVRRRELLRIRRRLHEVHSGEPKKACPKTFCMVATRRLLQTIHRAPGYPSAIIIVTTSISETGSCLPR